MHECLREHPEVFVPCTKELHFIDANYEMGLCWYSDRLRPSAGKLIVDEITPQYLHNDLAIKRMAAVVPGALLVVTLRNPTERAISAYHFFRDSFRGLTLGAACRSKPYLIELGLYAKHLRRVFAHYPKEAVKIFLYEDIQQEPEKVLADLYAFLGANPRFKFPSARVVYNSAYFPRANHGLRKPIWSLFRPFKSTIVGQWLRRWLSRKAPASGPITQADMRYLSAVFREDILQLQEMIGRDLSSWLAFGPPGLATCEAAEEAPQHAIEASR
jgi:hypothetical protein